MPKVDLSSKIPENARWVRVHYEITPKKRETELIARVWSGALDDAVVLRGRSGDVLVRLDEPQSLSYQRPVTVDLKLKIVAYKTEDE